MNQSLHKLGEFSFIACLIFGLMAFLSFIFGVAEKIITINLILGVIRISLIDLFVFMFLFFLLLIPLRVTD